MMIRVFPHLCCWFPLKNWWELFKHHHCGPHVLVRLINHCEITVNSSSTKCFQFSSHPTFPMIPQNFPRFSQIVIFRSPHSVLLTVQLRFQLSFVHQQASTSVWVLCGHFMLNQFPQVSCVHAFWEKRPVFPKLIWNLEKCVILTILFLFEELTAHLVLMIPSYFSFLPSYLSSTVLSLDGKLAFIFNFPSCRPQRNPCGLPCSSSDEK